MRIQIEKFLAVTAMLASTAVIAGGCSSEDTKTNNPGSGGSGAKGGTGGKDGSTGGTGGTATGGAAGTSTGGAAGGGGVAGGGGTAGSGGAACLGDGDPDAGTEGIDCTGLTYYGTMCGADPDAGVEGTANLGTQFCEYMSANGRAEVSADVYSCLAVITDPCSTAGEAAVQSCYSDAAQKACQHAPLSDNDGGTYDPCVDLNSTCAEVSVAECNLALNPLTSTYVMTVLQCYDAATGNCKTDFEDCVNLP